MTPAPGQVQALLEQVRLGALQLVAEVGQAPRNLRVRAGDVSVEIEWADPDVSVPVAVPVSVPVQVAPTHQDEDTAYITAPAVGVFYLAPQPGAEPFVAEGDLVQPGQQVGIVEAMKLMIPVETDQAGVVAGVLKKDGEAVEYAERLFAFVPGDE
jgi:acetyl-CoA carboxylase biotin carboxyl carrier protein